MNNCAFQYATSDGHIYENTGLISISEANELWEEYIPLFKQHLCEDKEPEMVVWINMKHEDDYHTTISHWHYEDMLIENNGDMYMKVKV